MLNNELFCVFRTRFFYSLVYDPQQKTLLADKGEIRVGSKYQAEVSKFPKLKEGKILQWQRHRGKRNLVTNFSRQGKRREFRYKTGKSWTTQGIFQISQKIKYSKLSHLRLLKFTTKIGHK